MKNLKHLLQPINIQLSSEQLEKFSLFKDLLLKANARTNLTRIPEEEIELLHFADSLYAAQEIDTDAENLSAIDIGTGGGFPGIPLAIVYEHIEFVLVDSAKRKVDFLEYALLKLGLKNCTALHARAEELAADSEHAAAYDIGFARAVASSEKLSELIFPLLKDGGKLIALKGPAEEASEDDRHYTLPETDIQRVLHVLTKEP